MLKAVLTTILVTAAAPATHAMALCHGAHRVTCVVDGDTVWIDHEKIRLADIDAPETNGVCEGERILAARASGRLARLLTGAPIAIDRRGKDRYGRTLATLSVGDRNVGSVLVSEGLARPWRGHREHWCGPAG